jgi:hypothetical protein
VSQLGSKLKFCGREFVFDTTRRDWQLARLFQKVVRKPAAKAAATEPCSTTQFIIYG